MRVALLALLALAGCGPIKYAGDIEPFPGNSVYVEVVKIGNCHAQLDRAGTEAFIKSRSEEWLKARGYRLAATAGEADLVLRAEVAEFHLGNRAARVFTNAGEAWHDTTIHIKPKQGMENMGRRYAEVETGRIGIASAEAARRYVVDEIAKMHVWVADEYLER